MLRVGIIGAGLMASGYDEPKDDIILSHAHAVINNKGLFLSGFYDINVESAQAASKKWNTSHFQNMNDLLDNSDIVCCAVSDNAHYDVLKKIINRSSMKAIICEKPITTDLENGNEIVQLTHKNKIPLFVNYSRRFMPVFRLIKQEIYDMGRFLSGSAYYGKGLIHNGSHMVNLIDYLVGLEKYKVHSIKDQINDFTKDDPSIGFILSDGNSFIDVSIIPCDIVTAFELELFFEKGKVVYDDAVGEVSVYRIKESPTYRGYRNYLPDKVLTIDRSGALKILYDDVLHNIENGGSIQSDGESAVRTLELCFLIKDEVR